MIQKVQCAWSYCILKKLCRHDVRHMKLEMGGELNMDSAVWNDGAFGSVGCFIPPDELIMPLVADFSSGNLNIQLANLVTHYVFHHWQVCTYRPQFHFRDIATELPYQPRTWIVCSGVDLLRQVAELPPWGGFRLLAILNETQKINPWT